MKKLRKTIKTRADYDAFASALDAYIKLCHVEKRKPQYVKHFGTFVNNWTDYLSHVSVGGEEPLSQLKRILEGKL